MLAAAAALNGTAVPVGLVKDAAVDVIADHLNITDPSKLTLITFFVAAVFSAIKRLFRLCRGKCGTGKKPREAAAAVSSSTPSSASPPSPSTTSTCSDRSTQTAGADLSDPATPPPVPRGESSCRRRPVYLQVDTSRALQQQVHEIPDVEPRA